MPFLAPVATFLGFASVSSMLITAASIAYQINRSSKAKKRAEAEAERRKGFEVTHVDAAKNLPVYYGYNKAGSTVTDYFVKSTRKAAVPTGYVSGDYEPSGGTYSYDGNNYIELTVTGTTGVALNSPDVGNEIVNLTSIRTLVQWNGVELYKFTKNNTNSPEGFLATRFSDYRSSIYHVEIGDYFYYPGTAVRISDTVYRFHIRRAKKNAAFRTFRGNTTWDSDAGGSTNEYMFVQNAVSFAGINDIVNFDFDGVHHGHKKFLDRYMVNVYKDGGVADTVAVANGSPATNTFTKTAYLSGVYYLNRNDPQWRDVPSLQLYLEGQKIREVKKSGSTYYLSTEYTFSNNSARVLLDYLLSKDYGRGLPLSKIDLKSFYEAQQVCDTVVKTNATVGGKIFGGNSVRDIRLYEFNGPIDTSRPIRDNIEDIMESMGQGSLIWSGGKYKLRVVYPNQQPSTANGLVDAAHVFNDTDIIADEIDISWPNAQDKYNQMTIRFPNAYKDFKDDSVTWPRSFSAVHSQFLDEDNNQPLHTELSIDGIIDPYHAMAKAEELVRLSRTANALKVTLSKRAMTLEPGDFFILSSDAAQLTNQVYRVESVTVTQNLSVEIEAYSFNHETLAWNVDDDVAYGDSIVFDTILEPPQNIIFDKAARRRLGTTSGTITWNPPEDISNVYRYQVEVSDDNQATWGLLGETDETTFSVPGLDNGVYSFRVRSRTLLGRLSEPSIARNDTGADDFTIQRETSDKVAVVYADDIDHLTNTQSYSVGENKYVAYYTYSGDLPTLPIRADISFSLFVGPAGADGAQAAQLAIYKRATSQPATPSSASYRFSTGELTGIGTWTTYVPSGTDPVWISVASAYSASGGPDLDEDLVWSTPQIGLRDGQDGVSGVSGLSTYQATVYRRSASQPAAPSGGQFNFDTNTLTPPTSPDRWYKSAPSGSNPLWACSYLFSAPGDNATVNGGAWSQTTEIARDGEAGPSGISTFLVTVFKRSVNQPSTPSVNTGGYNFTTNTVTPPSGWSATLPAGDENLWGATAMASIEGPTGSDNNLSWTVGPIAARGARGLDGDTGTPGQSVAQVQIYRRSSSTPAQPSGGTFNFNTLSLSGLPSGWTATIPTGTGTLWTCLSSATATSPAYLHSGLVWSNPEKLTQDGADGPRGYSTYHATVYRRSASQPAAPSGGSFNFGTNVLSPPSKWFVSPPANNGEKLWFSTGLFAVKGDVATDNTVSWSTPAQGSGDDGKSTFLVSVYKRKATEPSTPTNGSYNFTTNTITPPTNPGEWYTTIPAGTTPVWVATALASVNGPTGIDSSLTWSVSELVRNGEDGANGVTGERGPGWWRVDTVYNPDTRTSEQINSAFIADTGLTPVPYDVAIVYQTTEANPPVAWVYNGTIWNKQAAFIDGNLVVNGTVTGDKIDTNDFNARGLAVFGDRLRSSNYSTSQKRGWQIEHSGDATFYGDVRTGDGIMNRHLVLNSGSFQYNEAIPPGGTKYMRLVNMGIKIGQDDVWATSRRGLLVHARAVPSSMSGTGMNSIWGVTGEIFQGFAVTGGSWSSRTVNNSWTLDPATTVKPPWSSGTSQRVFANFKIFNTGLTMNAPITVYWKVLEIN